MKIAFHIPFAALLSIPTVAFACSYPEPPTFVDSLSEATSVAVLYVESAHVYVDPDSGEPDSRRVEATIRVVSSLKGEQDFTRLVYVSHWCGGNRIDVGHYFIAATKQIGPILRLVPTDQSILHLKYGYPESHPTRVPDEVKHIQKFLENGTPLPDYFSDPYFLKFTQGLPPPPPPPCAPCNTDGR
jgi:hypothetical protein